MTVRRVALRMDDVGASTKRYEVYSIHEWRRGPLRFSGNWLFLKYLPPFKRWAPYRELTASEWTEICAVLARARAKLTVAVTAAWVDGDARCVPFPVRFPDAARALKAGVEAGVIEIANHGLTHCVVEGMAFKPRWFASNRAFHREFWDWVPAAVQDEHLRRSQEILRDYFATEVVTFVPPGDVFTDGTLELAARHGLRYLSSRVRPSAGAPLVPIDSEDVVAFHDRDVVRHGAGWLAARLQEHAAVERCFVRQLASTPEASPLASA
jgi:peptidoglycan/xylan/chitin deacetylase (PgdA/CDA1 family)